MSGERRYDTGQRGELFARLLAANYPSLYRFVLTLVTNRTDAEEVVQQTIAELWAKFDDFEPDAPGSSFGAWATASARFVIKRHFRTASRRGLSLSGPLLDQIADRAEQMGKELDTKREALSACLERLDERQRQLLRLRYEEGQIGQQMAERLGVSTQAIYKSLGRIHSALLRCVRDRLNKAGSR